VADLISIEQARAAVLRHARPLGAEVLPVGQGLGRHLAENVVAEHDVPAFPNSAMDGFAVRAGAGGRTLAVVGESRAGAPAARGPGTGEALRISTGAVLPPGADAIVRVEDTAERDGTVEIEVRVPPGKEVRRAGEDIGAGEQVLDPGRLLGAVELGVAASVGASELRCRRRPTVSILVTGDELVEPGVPLGAGQIRNTNGVAIEALARDAGAEVMRHVTVGDDYRATVDALEAALSADVAVTTGGVSVGPHDHVKPALEELGVDEVFWGVALRPGKPTWFGTRDNTLVFGLPGNPVSAIVTFHLFTRPALAALLGLDPRARRTTAVMDAGYGKAPGRAHFVRCRLEARDDGWHVRPTKQAQASHVLTSMLDAEALAYLEVERGDVAAGERVAIEIL
jgi:molybdopterin molybdotransferase